MNEDPLASLSHAQPWSLATGQAGTGLIFAGLSLFLLAALLSALSAKKPFLGRFAGGAFVLASLSLFGAFGCLATLFVRDQFQYQYVYSHGDINTTLAYKIAGVWSGQQGSFLLWATASAIFGLLTMRAAGLYRPAYLAVFSVFLATLCGILAYETPFSIPATVVMNGKTFIPPSGTGLAPSLMNYWVVIHPPTIFLGFGSLTVLFAFSIAAMLHRNVREWIAMVRPWALVSLAILGLGICMGGFWAYETLGWGGFWAWDPVENASFVPWLFLAAFIHGIIVQAGKKRWHGANLVLGALPFLSFCYGTFLTRGGFLDKVSVHSFASMNKSALVILEWFIGGIVAIFTAIYLWRGRALAREANAAPVAGISRESLYTSGMLLLTLTAIVLALGMSWPLAMGLMNRPVASVEEGLYHQVMVWFFVPIILGIAITPFVSWRPIGVKELWRRVFNVLCVSVGLTGALLLALKFPDWGTPASAKATVSFPGGLQVPTVPWVGFLVLICMFAVVANVWRAVEMFKKSKSSIGGFVAHLGLATLLAGLILSRGLEQKQQTLVQAGQQDVLAGYTIEVKNRVAKDNFDRDGKLLIAVTGPNGEKFEATPGLYFRPSDDGGQPEAMVWPYIRHYGTHDFYLSLGQPIVTLWEKPTMLKVGETNEEGKLKVKYLGMIVEGEPGTPSAVFKARCEVTDEDGTRIVVPAMSVANGPEFARINRHLQIAMTRMDAADKSAELQVFFNTPIYPVEVFTKPLTELVWGGTGILTLGGLLSAYARRRRKARSVAVTEREPETITTDAPIPVT